MSGNIFSEGDANLNEIEVGNHHDHDHHPHPDHQDHQHDHDHRHHHQDQNIITTGKGDSHLNGVDCGDLSAASIEVILEVRQEDSKTEK